MDGTTIGPDWPPSPHPHPWLQQKSPARGTNSLYKNTCLISFNHFYDNCPKQSLLSGIAKCLKGVLTKTIVAVFPRGSKKRKSNNDDKHDHGQKNSIPSTYVEGQNSKKYFGREIVLFLMDLHHTLHARNCIIFPWLPHTPRPLCL